MKYLLILSLVFPRSMEGPSLPPEVPCSSCWSACANCKTQCSGDRNCISMCEAMNETCCVASGREPYLSGCGCE